jgi:serine/threonine-protein kinase
MCENIVLKERYKILDVINTNHFIVNYKAIDMKTNNYLIIKELTNNFNNILVRNQAIKQFMIEAKIIFKSIHPNLPGYEDYFDYDYKRYLVMKYIEGKTFETIVNETTDFIDERHVVTWGIEICNALSYLHTIEPNPIIFRNLRPDNIILSKNGTLKLIDFGISKFFQPEGQTLDVAKIINPNFSPIEQYSGKTDARTDIYSLGAVLYFMATLTRPADSIDIHMGTRHLSPCSLFNQNLTQEFDEVILRAMRMCKENRYQTAEDFKWDLNKLLQ